MEHFPDLLKILIHNDGNLTPKYYNNTRIYGTKQPHI